LLVFVAVYATSEMLSRSNTLRCNLVGAASKTVDAIAAEAHCVWCQGVWCQGGEIGEQSAETVHGKWLNVSRGGLFGGGLAARCRRRPGFGHRRGVLSGGKSSTNGTPQVGAVDNYPISDHAPDASLDLSEPNGFPAGIVVAPELILLGKTAPSDLAWCVDGVGDPPMGRYGGIIARSSHEVAGLERREHEDKGFLRFLGSGRLFWSGTVGAGLCARNL
jgi:hypothetical protein